MRHIAHTIAIKGKIFGIIFPEKWIYDVWTPILIIIIIKTRCYFEIEYPLYCMLPAQINLAFMAWYIFVKYITCSYSLVHSSGDMIFRRSYNHIKKQIDEIHDHCKANHLKCWTMVFKYVEIRTDFWEHYSLIIILNTFLVHLLTPWFKNIFTFFIISVTPK